MKLQLQLQKGEITEEEYNQKKYKISTAERKKAQEAIRQSFTGGLITPRTAGIFELHQGEMVLDNKAVAAFTKSLDLVNMSQQNALAAGGGGNPVIINAPNVDNSNRVVSQTRVNVPMPVRTGESTKAALDLAYN